jgi:hypothetical protein
MKDPIAVMRAGWRKTALAAIVVLSAACASSGGGSVSGSVYVGAGYYDPWYWDAHPVPPPGAIGPPDRPVAPPHPSHPIAHPPSRPAPMPRPAARSGRR